MSEDCVHGLILIVDDNKVLTNSMALLLTVAGFEVEISYCGHDALECLRHRTPDIIISDLDMPNGNGYALLEAVRSSDLWRHIRFIVASAKYAYEDLMHVLDMGADDYVPKPYDIYDILDAIQRSAADVIFEPQPQHMAG